MFCEAPILIAEDNLYLSLDLSIAVEEMDGRVVGPASSVAEALTLLARNEIAGAIVDFQLADHDASPLARQLAERHVPFVIHTATAIPLLIGQIHPEVPILMKPLQASAVLTCLLGEIRKAQASRLPTAGQPAALRTDMR
jgi:DNA-binding NtrC family response regulator